MVLRVIEATEKIDYSPLQLDIVISHASYVLLRVCQGLVEA
jgi:hypothetical protein